MSADISRRNVLVGLGSSALLPAFGAVPAFATPIQASTSMETAASGGAPFLHFFGEASPSSRAKAAKSDPPGYDDMFQLPLAHSLMNANLATIKMVDPNHPDHPSIDYEGHGVRANIIITGVAGTKSLTPQTTGYGIPAVSIVQDILVYGDDPAECLVQSTIPFPFYTGTILSHAITQCKQPPDLTSEIAGYIIDQVVSGALIAAANATGQQWSQTPLSMGIILDELFLGYDKAMRTSVGDEINAALRAINSPIPFEITTGDLMAPFLNFSVPPSGVDKNNRTIDIQFNSVGFSTMLRTVDPQSHQVVLGTALSLQASGQGHLSKAGLNLTLNYKFSVGGGLLPLGAKYAAQINAMISKLESHLNKLFLSELDALLFVVGGSFPIPRLLSAPRHQAHSSSRWAASPERRSSSLIP